MEGFILFIIIAVISTVLGRNKEANKDTKQMPPFNKNAKEQPASVRPKKERPTIQSFEDFAKEFVGELKETMEQQQPELKPLFSKVEKKKKKASSEQVSPPEKQNRQAERPKLEERLNQRLEQRQTAKAVVSAVPTSRQELVQAFVMSEVLGPPKAKQRTKIK